MVGGESAEAIQDADDRISMVTFPLVNFAMSTFFLIKCCTDLNLNHSGV